MNSPMPSAEVPRVVRNVYLLIEVGFDEPELGEAGDAALDIARAIISNGTWAARSASTLHPVVRILDEGLVHIAPLPPPSSSVERGAK